MSDIPHVLLLDEDPEFRRLGGHLLSALGYEVSLSATGREALKLLGDDFDGVVLIDAELSLEERPSTWRQLCERSPQSPRIFLTRAPLSERSVEAIPRGAFGLLDKADAPRQFARLLPQAFARLQKPRRDRDPAISQIIAESDAMRTTLRSVRGVPGTSPALIRGEVGTGKTLIARLLHESSPRRKAPFVIVNCAGLPEPGLIAAIFGAEAGVLGPMADAQPGAIARAAGGSVLLEEIGELPATVQARLLRFIRDGRYNRLGGLAARRGDARLIGSSHRSLNDAVTAGRFRQDLYYRLAGVTILVPPLRERSDDIAPLSRLLLRQLALEARREIAGFRERAMALLQAHSFPGNVWELKNIIVYAIRATNAPQIAIGDLPPDFLQRVVADRRRQEAERRLQEPEPALVIPATESRAERVEGFLTLEELKSRHVRAALALTDNNKARAAKLLGISRMTLYRRIQEFEDAESFGGS